MLKHHAISLLCPRNDLESDTILNIAQSYAIHHIEIKGTWGITLSEALSQIDINSLKQHVLLVELKTTPHDLAQLQAAGKQVHLIDHHQYSESDKTLAQTSSLEQFATLIGHQLTEYEWQVAINDRDFITGLSQMGVNWQDMHELRHQEHKIQGVETLVEAARHYFADNKRDFNELIVILSPEKYSKVMLEVAQYPSEQDYNAASAQKKPISLKSVLVIYHDDNDPKLITQIEYAGNSKQRDWLADVVNEAKWANDFILWLGGGIHGCFFGAIAKMRGFNFDSLVSFILSHTLFTGRPLRHYSCDFYLPLDLFSETALQQQENHTDFEVDKSFKPHTVDADISFPYAKVKDIPPNEKQPFHEKQAFLYFEPHLREALIEVKNPQRDETIKPIKHWRIPQQKREQMTLTLPKYGLSAKFEEISLFKYYNGLYLFNFRISPTLELDENSSLTAWDASWWHDLVYVDMETLQPWKMNNWLIFTNLARIIYPTYFEQVDEAKLTNIVLTTEEKEIEFKNEDDLSPVLVHLINLFFQTDEQQLKDCLNYLPEDRLYVAPRYGLSGVVENTPHIQERLQYLFSLALYVDKGGFKICDDYAYDPEFTRDLLNQHSLHRWDANGVYSGYCGYANAYMGFDEYFVDPIATSHAAYIYNRMLILALFYQATLRHYNRRISYATSDLTRDTSDLIYDASNSNHNTSDLESNKLESFRELRRQFIEFTNNYWFREVTPQIQGQEIFAKQTQALNLDKEYDMIKDEMERADEYTTVLRDLKLGELNSRISITNVIIAVVAVVLALVTALR